MLGWGRIPRNCVARSRLYEGERELGRLEWIQQYIQCNGLQLVEVGWFCCELDVGRRGSTPRNSFQQMGE